MILKGKYWLKIDNPEVQTLTTIDTGIAVNYSITMDGTVYNLPTLRFCNYISDWEVYYYNVSGSYFPNGSSSICAGYCNPPVEVVNYYSQEARLIDFGDEPQTVTMDTNVEQMFNLLFIPLSKNEFVSESNLAQITNKLLDEMYNETMSKILALRPTITSNLVTSSSGVSSVAQALNNYDMVFIRANAYSSYTPLCYTIPAKAICSAGVTSIPFKVADNAQNTMFKIASTNSPSYSISRTSGSGLIFQMYGLKFPTPTTGVN